MLGKLQVAAWARLEVTIFGSNLQLHTNVYFLIHIFNERKKEYIEQFE